MLTPFGEIDFFLVSRGPGGAEQRGKLLMSETACGVEDPISGFSGCKVVR